MTVKVIHYIITIERNGGLFMTDKVYTIDEIKQILNKLLENMPVYRVVLFGSYAKNSANSFSDLDFVIDTKNTLMGFKLLSLIIRIEEAFNKQVDAFEAIEIIVNSKVHKEIKETGVIVYER